MTDIVERCRTTYELYRVVTGSDPDDYEYYEQVACNGKVMWPREVVQRLNTLDAVCDQAVKEIQEQQVEIERLRAKLTAASNLLSDPRYALFDVWSDDADKVREWDNEMRRALSVDDRPGGGEEDGL